VTVATVATVIVQILNFGLINNMSGDYEHVGSYKKNGENIYIYIYIFYLVHCVGLATGMVSVMGIHQVGALRRFVHVAMRLFSGDI